ncbi:hypothetical protein QA640_22510 [Bradyrhizobium sp. CB82]|jgi:hypothetical protein|uniref:hypothetical protein n=1 Tax=Bradyrhizobium sp. CB82 TaxID=3039159 RepID=UPI0024B101E5|nr:hypothetical protein [Bradyrhizobium sp. CB82]WFU37271.1 hypothetical protein QA640_22510 [Bradyrhizobium sp. CB82]
MPADVLSLDIIVPILVYCALLWWVGRGMGWTARLATAAVTLVLVVCVLLVERGWR